MRQSLNSTWKNLFKDESDIKKENEEEDNTMKSDIEIAQEACMLPITEVAEKLTVKVKEGGSDGTGD